MTNPNQEKLFGLAAEFNTPEQLISAAEKAKQAGYTKMDAYSPFPLHGIDEAMGVKNTALPKLVLLGGVIGLVGGFLLQYWTSAVDYPINIGGRPLLSIPAFVPVTFECTILCASLTAAFGMLLLNGLPQPYHPLFKLEAFLRASRDKFFLCIEAKDSTFKAEETKKFLKTLNAEAIYEVED